MGRQRQYDARHWAGLRAADHDRAEKWAAENGHELTVALGLLIVRGLSALDSGAGIVAATSESTPDVAGRIEAAAARIEAAAAELMRGRGRNKASGGKWVEVAHMGLDVALGSLRSARMALQPVGSNSPDVGGALKSINAALSELNPYLTTPEAHIDPPPIPVAAERRHKERRADPKRPDKSPGRRSHEKPSP